MDEVGWYGDNSNNKTHPVGQKQPNAWGFYDMHGNVWEWCLDWWGEYPTTPVTDPTGPSSGIGTWRVMRGGSWNNRAWYCRSGLRFNYRPSGSLGFRVALAPVK